MYAKRGDVAACRVVLYRAVLEERPSVRVLASAVLLVLAWFNNDVSSAIV